MDKIYTTGELLKQLRLRAGLSQRKLSFLSGVDRGRINELEKGKRGDINLGTARKLAPPLGVPPAVFLEGDTHPLKETHEQILDRLKLAQPMSIPVYTDFPFPAGNAIEPVEYVYRARAKVSGKNIEGYYIAGDCLEPKISEGDIIIVDREGQIDEGDIVATLINDELHIGKLRKIADELYLENNHGRYKFEDCQLAAPVIEVIRRLK